MNAFIVNTSKGSVQIDADEVNKVLQGIASGSPVVVRQGIINPSYFVSIVEDLDRISEHRRAVSDTMRKNEQYEKLGIGKPQELPEMQPLQDIFKEIKLLK